MSQPNPTVPPSAPPPANGYPPGDHNHPGYGPYAGAPMPYYYGAQAETKGLESIFGDMSPKRLLRVALTRWLTLVLAMIFGIIFAYYFLSKKTPVYRATATIEMTVRRLRIMGADEAVMNTNWVNPEEEFNTRMEKFRGQRIRELAQAQCRKLPEAADFTDSELAAALAGVSFTLLPDSRLVKITLTHGDPDIAAMGANAYAQAAREMAMNENRSVSEDAVSWLHTQAKAQREILDKTEQAIVEFRKINHVAALENQARTVEDALSVLNEDLVQAKSAQGQSETILHAIENNPLTIDTIGQLPSSVPRLGEITRAIQQWTEAIQTCDTLLVKYTEEHPRVKIQRDVIEGQLKHVKEAAKRAKETAASDLALAVERVKALSSRQETLSRELSETSLKIIELKASLASLERERNAADVAFQGILNRIEEARLAADEETATIQVTELASVPSSPVFLNRPRYLGAGALLGACLGMGIALLKDIVDDHIVTPLDVELGVGVEILGAIPKIKTQKNENMDLICLKDKSSHTAELFAGIRSVLDLPPLNEQTDSLVVTSTQPGEGKTFNAINLAIMSARAGRKTLLVDFDLRRPRLRGVFDIPEGHPSLLHTLSQYDTNLFPGLPASTECPNLDVVTTIAEMGISPAEVLGNRFIGKFTEWAGAHYERVIFDSPPLGVLADSIVLSGLCKGVILVCHPNKTKRSSMRQLVRRFQKVNGNIIGVIINNIDLGHSGFKNYAQYGYAYNYAKE
ncbi:MAG: polysaccharide biosynthesis tyrosine autokinase [Lentisphaeria bacterium]|nr:polysaccharide biosynthesis tyrosine autokinase [Lentisphaeria bacterium]